MKKTIIILITLLLFLALPAAAKQGSPQHSLIPENTRWVIQFDMKKFASTRLCQLLLEDDHNKISKEFKKIHEKLKIDPMKDIQWVTIFGKGREHDTAAWFCKGNFDQGYLLSLLAKSKSHEEIQHGTYTIHSWGHQFGSFIGDHLLLFAKNELMIKHVLDVFTGKEKNIGTSGTMMSYLNELPGNAFFKAVADDIPSILGPHGKPVMLKKARAAFFIIMEKNGDLKLKLKVTTESAETAKNIEALARGFIALGKLQKQEKDPRWKLLEDLNISLKGNTLLAEWSHPSEDLINMLSHGKKEFHY